MICKNCGSEIDNKAKSCEVCGAIISAEDTEEEIIKEFLHEEPSIEIEKNIATVQISTRSLIALKVAKLVLAGCILVFSITFFMPWYILGGTATFEGVVEIPDNIATDEYLTVKGKPTDTYTGSYVKFSPVKQLIYAIKHFKVYKINIDSEGIEKVSPIAYTHLIVSLLYLILLISSLLAIGLLITMKVLKWIRLIKIASVISIIIIGLNYVFLKITMINMFILKAQSNIRVKDLLNGVDLTGKGIAVNREFYPYTIETTRTFVSALVLVGIWLVMSAILTEIKRKLDFDLLDLENEKAKINK